MSQTKRTKCHKGYDKMSQTNNLSTELSTELSTQEGDIIKEQYLLTPYNWLNKGLTPTELLVLSYITGFGKNGCFSSQEKMAKMFNVSRRTIVRSLEKLEKEKIIYKSKKKNEQGFDSNLYVSKLAPLKTGDNPKKSNNRFNNFEGREYTKEYFEDFERDFFN